jgi:DNA-binding IclR family transcriptional regulator
VCRTAAAPSAAAPVSATSRAVYHRLREVEQASIPQLARSLELSQSTVLRALRTLVAERRVERLGCARATRYRLRAAS